MHQFTSTTKRMFQQLCVALEQNKQKARFLNCDISCYLFCSKVLTFWWGFIRSQELWVKKGSIKRFIDAKNIIFLMFLTWRGRCGA